MNQARFPFLPIGTEINGLTSGRLLADHGDFQILASDGEILLLVASAEDSWVTRRSNRDLLAELDREERLTFWDGPEGRLLCLLSKPNFRPTPLADLQRQSWPLSSSQLEGFVTALSDLMRRAPGSSWARALLLSEIPACFDRGPEAGRAETFEDRRRLLIRIMTGGLITEHSERISEVNRDLSAEEIDEAFRRLGLDIATRAPVRARPPAGRDSLDGKPPFSLPGRPAISKLFEDYLIDYWRRPEHYRKVGYRPPGGILLYGETGTGKTYAATKLADYLGWPCHQIDLASIGSSYIHETAQRLNRVFETAASEAPALIIMNEVDSLAMARDGRHEHKVEELNQLLLLIEDAAAQQLLVVATTNRVEALDPAFLRRGRFDLQMEVLPPTAEELTEALREVFSARPLTPGVELADLGRRLLGRPMSDLEWFANEAARLAAQAGKVEIDDIVLARALRTLGAETGG